MKFFFLGSVTNLPYSILGQAKSMLGISNAFTFYKPIDCV